MHPTSTILCKVYKDLIKRERVDFKLHPTQEGKIDTVVKTVNAIYWGYSPYPSNKDKGAAYFYFLIKNHPVTDGNKRLAVLWLEIFSSVFKLEIKQHGITLDKLAVSIEKSNLKHTDMIRALKELIYE